MKWMKKIIFLWKSNKTKPSIDISLEQIQNMFE